MRVPGFRSRIFGRSFRLMSGSRNMVITVAFEKSVSNRSAFTNVARAGDAFLLGVALRELDHVRVVLDAEGARAALGGGDHGAAVARAEVHDEVGRRHLGHVEHLVDQGLRRRHPDDVLAFLPDRGLEGGGGFLGLREGERAAGGEREGEAVADKGRSGHARSLRRWVGRDSSPPRPRNPSPPWPISPVRRGRTRRTARGCPARARCRRRRAAWSCRGW